MAEVVLQAKDIAWLVGGLTEDGVKQWSIGRPYTIRPSIRSSTGKGIANLYSMDDALRFFIVRQMTTDNFQSRAIQRVLAAFNPSARALMIDNSGDVEFSEIKIAQTLHRFAERLARSPRKEKEFQKRERLRGQIYDEDEDSFYVLDIESLHTELNGRWRELQEEKEASLKRRREASDDL